MKRFIRPLVLAASLVAIVGLILMQGIPVSAQGVKDPKVYNFTWYDSLSENGMKGDWIVIGNLEDTATTAEVWFGNESAARAVYEIGPRGRQTVAWPETMGGPVRVVSPSGDTLVVTQRVLYQDSFNEVAAVESSNLGTPLAGTDDISYYFTWYDSLPQNGMKGNWILISNEGQETANVDVYIGGNLMNSYAIPAGGQITPQYANLMDGPVKVTSTNGQQLIVSQRVLYGDSFNEVTAVPEDQLDSLYFFTWYDMKRSTGMKGNWILMSNINDRPLTAEVYIGTNPNPRGTYELPPDESVTPIYVDLMDGPVKVLCTDCTNQENILVSQRVLYKDSFEEVQGTPPAGLSDELFFGWYDFKKANNMTGNWVLIANQNDSDSATVDVYIGSEEAPTGTYPIPAGDRVYPIYPELMGGPVRTDSQAIGDSLMVSQRVLYKDKSFNELLGLTRQDVGEPIVANPFLVLYKLNSYWASYSDYENGLLSVNLRLDNRGAADGENTSITGVTASSGVTVATPLPLPIGVVPGDGHNVFTVQYNVPAGVSGFKTGISAVTYSSGIAYTYPQ